MKYHLIDPTEEHFDQMYHWIVNEKQKAKFTCREVRPIPAFDEWIEKKFNRLGRQEVILKAMISSEDPNTCLGRFDAFDYNPRNQNFEIGYYFPGHQRRKGFGSIGLPMFIDEVFGNPLPTRKLTAWTSEKNIPSQKLLLKNGFHLDGTLRDHFEEDGKYYKQLIYSNILDK
jgi:RimJ/RimL family protein N-acetyltransferase